MSDTQIQQLKSKIYDLQKHIEHLNNMAQKNAAVCYEWAILFIEKNAEIDKLLKEIKALKEKK